jgi:hypothetical protein
MTDVVDCINRWLAADEVDSPERTLADARDEIISLRERLAESRDTLLLSMRESGKYAHRAGYCEGTLMMIEIGHAAPASAAKATLDHVREQQ